jgi:hypothetical protein
MYTPTPNVPIDRPIRGNPLGLLSFSLIVMKIVKTQKRGFYWFYFFENQKS